jgi:hypothetical protein
MIIHKNVESGSYPEAVKILTDKVLAANNVRQEQRVEEFADVERESITVYIYDVTEFTKDEYFAYLVEKDHSDIDYIAMMSEIDLEG